MQCFPESRGKLGTSVRYYLLGNTVQTYDPGNVEVCQLGSSVCGLDGYKMGNLGQTVNYDLDGIVSTIGPWKSGNKIHPYLIPLPLGNL